MRRFSPQAFRLARVTAAAAGLALVASACGVTSSGETSSTDSSTMNG